MQSTILALALAATGLAQQVPTKFEVASIKPNDANDNRVMISMAPGGGFSATGITLKAMIMQAYNVKDFQISGGPGWMASDRYDIKAKAGEGAPDRMRPEQLRTMLQALLEERFDLKIRRESKELPVYTLVQGKNGHKMKPAESVEGARNMMRMGRGQVDAKGIDMTGLARMLGNQAGRDVIDKTGLDGRFDILLNWTPEPGQGGGMGFGNAPPPPGAAPPHQGDSSGPSLFTALQEQLGLRLESAKGPVDTLIVENASKPSEN